MLRSLQLGQNPDTWKLLLDIYRPFLLSLLRAQSTPDQDLDDLIQEILLVVVRELPAFRHSGRTGAFRAWLRSIAANRLRTYWRGQGRAVPTDMLTLAEQFDDPTSELSRLWDARHDVHVLSRLLELAEARCEPTTFQAFRRVALEGADPTVVAAELNLSVAAVYIAKSRLLHHLRELAEGLVD
jgi:RNA polymerase sigma-70 factor (ECF subfamily)